METEPTVRQRAESLAAAGQTAEALAILEDLASAGNAEGMFTLGVWLATGERVARDLARARDLFARAAEGGLPNAAIIHTNFRASGVGGSADWSGALADLRRLARGFLPARQQLLLISDMKISSDGAPLNSPKGELISHSPHVELFRDLFSPTECDYLAAAAQPLLRPSIVVDPVSGKQVRNPIRTSDGAVFTWALENPAIHALNRRIAVASGTEVARGEPLQVLRYLPGQQYRTHLDAIAGFDNQRSMTMLVYLNNDYEGGETRFVSTGLDVRGRKGDGILFRNVDRDGRPDNDSAHAGLPVTSGTKLIASRWIRERTFVAPGSLRSETGAAAS